MTESGGRQAQMYGQPENQGKLKIVTLDQTMTQLMITDPGRPTATPTQTQTLLTREFSDKIDNQQGEKIVAKQPQSPQDLQFKANEVRKEKEKEAELHLEMCRRHI
jgi:hypothetical protein